ncbi:hypothetical protein CJF30_00009115 [Rutstroemia sp. NJR-2017a BBW]|nr:hypothetical protein CJF30_00009115 [Rutstroemia sp. NJR-2017a BBW]
MRSSADLFLGSAGPPGQMSIGLSLFLPRFLVHGPIYAFLPAFFYILPILTKLSRPRLPWPPPVYFDIFLAVLSRSLLHTCITISGLAGRQAY